MREIINTHDNMSNGSTRYNITSIRKFTRHEIINTHGVYVRMSMSNGDKSSTRYIIIERGDESKMTMATFITLIMHSLFCARGAGGHDSCKNNLICVFVRAQSLHIPGHIVTDVELEILEPLPD